MAFFRSAPNIGDHEKARLEFQLQEIAESIGFDRFQKPVVRAERLLALRGEAPEDIAAFAADHLGHQIAGLQVQTAIEAQEKCGGGG